MESCKQIIDSEGFTKVVCHRRKRSSTKHNLETLCLSKETDIPNAYELSDTFNEKLSGITTEISCSEFFNNCKVLIFKAFTILGVDCSYSSIASSCKIGLPQENEQNLLFQGEKCVVDIVCYGLGEFLSCVNAQYQLGFLLQLKVLLNAEVYAYDPIFSDAEKNILKKLKLHILQINEEGKRPVESHTIFFMPHCGKPLYNSVLWANWSVKRLSKVIIIGNSFQNIVESFPKRYLMQHVPYIFRSQPITKEIPIPNIFRFSDIFNNLSIHVFEKQKMISLPDEMWLDCEEPHYTSEDEITVNPVKFPQ